MVGLVLALLGVACAYVIIHDREATLARGRESLETRARVIDENLAQQLMGVGAALGTLRDEAAALLRAGEERLLANRLQAMADAMPHVRTMLVIDEHGTARASSRPELTGLQLADRPYFETARTRPARDTVYLSAPFVTRLNVWSINMSKVWLAALQLDGRLVATISRPVAAALAPWRRTATVYGLLYAVVVATVLVAGWLVQRKQRDLQALRSAREQESREQAERLEMALAGGDLGLWDLDLRTGVRTVNARAHEMVGLRGDDPAEELARWAQRLHPDDRDAWTAARLANQAGDADAMVSDYRVRHEDGHWVWLHSRGKVTHRDAEGRPCRMAGTYLDVTERKNADAQLAHSAQLLARMSRVSRTGGWHYDLRTGRSTWSDEMFRIRELDPTVVPDRDVVMNAYLPQSQARLATARQAAIDHQTPWDMELQMVTAEGRQIWVRSQGEAVVEEGVTVALTGTLKNVTYRKQAQIDLKEANEKLERMALSDGLTGIANRRLFDQTLQVEWKRCARAHLPIALLMIDIDHFKLYNDHYGHAGGDECLRRVAGILAACPRRAGDLVCRFGGEEFAILLPGGDLKSAASVAQSCLDAVAAAGLVHAASPVGPCVTVSIGAACSEAPAGEPVISLIERADRALYRAKHRGRARYETLGEDA